MIRVRGFEEACFAGWDAIAEEIRQKLPDTTQSKAVVVVEFYHGVYGQEIRNAPNTWHLMTVNPDGTSFQRHVWTPRYIWAIDDDSGSSDTYAATQPAVVQVNGQTHIAYTMQADNTMVHSTQFTGIRVGLPGIDYIYANTQPAIA